MALAVGVPRDGDHRGCLIVIECTNSITTGYRLAAHNSQEKRCGEAVQMRSVSDHGASRRCPS